MPTDRRPVRANNAAHVVEGLLIIIGLLGFYTLMAHFLGFVPVAG